MDIREFCAQRDMGFFIRVYNESTKYAPFSAPLNENYMCNYVLKDVGNDYDFIYISDCEGSEGIIHFGLNPYNKKEGVIKLLIGTENSTARRLLEHAENKLTQIEVDFIRAFTWVSNPYQFILHGAEPYCWAGLYPANNAFHKFSYDIDLDLLIMNKHMDKRPDVIAFDNEDIVIKEVFFRDDELVTNGQYVAYYKDKQVGRCGYYNLKAISKHLNKGYGQIDIWTDDQYHGKNLSYHLITLVHQKLYDLKVRNVILATNQNLFRAIKFYEKIGYKAEPIKAYSYSKKLKDA